MAGHTYKMPKGKVKLSSEIGNLQSVASWSIRGPNETDEGLRCEALNYTSKLSYGVSMGRNSSY